MRFFIHIGYKGSKYFGWQRQPDQISVQQTLEDSLHKILKRKIIVHGCGRTDSGVHAAQYFFHVDLEEKLEFDLMFRWNHILPNDISIFEIIPVDGKPHARFDAIQRSYDYYLHTKKDPFLNDFSTLIEGRSLNLPAMQRAVEILPNYDDYRAFCKSPDKNEHTICEVSAAQLFTNENKDRLRFYISSNRFLGRMIRIIVRKLLEIGEGELTLSEFESHLRTKEIPKTIIPSPPQGLFLSGVTYPYLSRPVQSDFLTPITTSNNYWIPVENC